MNIGYHGNLVGKLLWGKNFFFSGADDERGVAFFRQEKFEVLPVLDLQLQSTLLTYKMKVDRVKDSLCL